MAGPTALQATRKRLGYSAERVVRMIVDLGASRGLPVATAASLKTQLSRWENGRQVEDVMYRRLLCEIYGRTPAELDFPDEPTDEGADELRSRLLVARSVDTDTARLFFNQIEHTRRAARRFGAVGNLDQVRAQIAQVESLVRHGVGASARSALARALAEASALAGWEALDRVALRPAWDHHETAIQAAREAGSTAHLAHAMAQQAIVLIDLDMAELAVERVAEARALASARVSPLLLSWLAATGGEVRAAAGDREAALRAFDEADELLPTDPQEPDLPFLYLADGHLDRWRGHVLARLGEPDAVAQLRTVLDRLPTDFVRARSSTLADLAYAHAARGERDPALDYSQQARRNCKPSQLRPPAAPPRHTPDAYLTPTTSTQAFRFLDRAPNG